MSCAPIILVPAGPVLLVQESPGVLVIPQGLPGRSAYELAVDHGFEGTEEEWLASLGGGGGGGGEKSVHMVGTVVPLAFAIVASALSARTIQVLNGLRTAAGTCRVTIAINGTPVTGLTDLAASSTPANHTATATNAIAEGDEVTVTIADVSGATDLKFTIGME